MMKRLLVKISAALICFVMIFSLFGCKSYEPIEPSEEELRVVGTVGEFEVLYEEIRFVVLTKKAELLSEKDDNALSSASAKAEFEAELRELVYESLLTNYAVLTLCREVGIEADNEKINEAVQNTIKQTIDDVGSTSKYKKYLADNHLTDHFLRFNITVDKLQNELFYSYVDDLGLIESEDEKVYEKIRNEFIRTQHIYISKKNGKTEKENLNRVNEALEALNDGEDFFETSKLFSEDTSMTRDGIYSTKGYMSETYEAVAYELGIEEFSDVVEDKDGYYIIKRIETDPFYIMIHFDELSDMYKQYTFLGMIDEAAKELEFVPNEFFKSLNLLDIK